jgi:hypothetical protein
MATGCARFLHRGTVIYWLRRVARLDDLGEVIYASAPAVLGNAEGLSMDILPSVSCDGAL